MRYFVKGWTGNVRQVEKIIRKYQAHYKSIEKQLSNDVKKVINNRHDTHIVRTYFLEKNYVMELDERVWGKVKFVFRNATVRHNSDIKDEYWLYEEIYKIQDKIEIHILFNKSDIIILCDDAYISIEDRDYFKELYEKQEFNIDLFNNTKIDIINAVTDKELTCGNDMLKPWEQLVFSFRQIYFHINYYKYNNIEDLLKNHYHSYSVEEQKEIYIKLFEKLEKDLINNINILKKYQEVIKEEDLNYMINRLLGVYNKKNMAIEKKNQLYIDLNEHLQIDLNNIYKRILKCIDEGLIK